MNYKKPILFILFFGILDDVVLLVFTEINGVLGVFGFDGIFNSIYIKV